ncbi:MAG: response regulator transcription factor, partial [Bacteroidia bacterium]|nr:response regulator transcription factor [Bacteroidia bacterium]
IRILLADDHQIVRDGIKSLLGNLENLEVVSEAGNSREVLKIFETEVPDIAILDISMPDMSGIELTRLLKAKYPDVKILILSMYNDDEFVINAIKAGADGYLPKNSGLPELSEAICSIIEGQEFFSKTLTDSFFKSYVKKVRDNPLDSIQLLSKREIEILKMCAEGFINKEIADKLFISIRTVESHKNHIMQKLELKTTADMIRFAIKNKIVNL